MGESKRRQSLDPSFGKAVFVQVEQSPISNKWLCVVYILGCRCPISPHFKYEDAVNASKQVDANFNRVSYHDWRDFIRNGNERIFRQALQTLDYECDDEVIGIGHFLPDGTLSIDQNLDDRSVATEHINALALVVGQASSICQSYHLTKKIPRAN